LRAGALGAKAHGFCEVFAHLVFGVFAGGDRTDRHDTHLDAGPVQDVAAGAQAPLTEDEFAVYGDTDRLQETLGVDAGGEALPAPLGIEEGAPAATLGASAPNARQRAS
jgi:hypothetical protein